MPFLFKSGGQNNYFSAQNAQIWSIYDIYYVITMQKIKKITFLD